MQRNVGANAGLDWAGWGALLRCIAGRSLEHLRATAAGEPAAGGFAAGGEVPPALAQVQAAAAQLWRSPWHHAFRLQRAGRLLRQLAEEQRRVDASNSSSSGRGRGSSQAQQPEAPAAGGAGAAGKAAYHEAEAAANAACLQSIEAQLHAMGLPLPG